MTEEQAVRLILGAEENSESTGREIVAFWNWDRKNYFVR